MPNQYGDDTEPGIITKETSASTLVTGEEVPTDIFLVGPADLDNATSPAEEEKVYEIRGDRTATQLFGPKESSLLTSALIDQLREGAAPIYAMAPNSTSVTSEDHSAASETTVSLENSPMSEDTADFTITLDSTDLTVHVTREDVSTKTPEADEAYVNPNTGKMEIPTVPSTSLEVDYTHFDYIAALSAFENNQEAIEAADFVMAVQETESVQTEVISTVKALADEGHYSIALVAPDSARIEPATYENRHDSSRVQVIYPTRFTDGTSAMAAVAGKKAFLGLDRTPIKTRLETQKQLAVSLTRGERGSLIGANVVPLENRVNGAVIRDDPTSVTDDNADERNINYSFKRLALDYVYDVSEENEEPFIGLLHKDSVRNSLADLISGQLTAMRDSDIIEAYNVRIFEETATRARLELDIDAPEPLRFIENDVRIGDFE